MLNRFVFALSFACCLMAGEGIAQDSYWVIETNIHSRDTTIVKVYDLGNQLIAQTYVMGTVDITRKRDRRMLNRIAKHSVKEPAGVMARKPKRPAKTGG